jgi:hypothetical protein
VPVVQDASALAHVVALAVNCSVCTIFGGE